MNILITGTTGGLGHKLCNYFREAGHNVTGTWRDKPSSKEDSFLDLTDFTSIRNVFEEKVFDICFHAAGISQPDICEKDPSLAYVVNVQGTKYIQRMCEEKGVRLVFFSTDYVFSGSKDIYSEEDSPDPIQVYGRTKAQAEELFVGNSEVVILRIGLLYDDCHGPFKRIYKELHDNKVKEIRLSEQQIRYPLHTNDVCYYSNRIMNEGGPSVIHLAGPDAYSKYEAALLIGRLSGAWKKIVSDEPRQQIAKRPDHVYLSQDKLHAYYQTNHTTHFEAGIRDCISTWGGANLFPAN